MLPKLEGFSRSKVQRVGLRGFFLPKVAGARLLRAGSIGCKGSKNDTNTTGS